MICRYYILALLLCLIVHSNGHAQSNWYLIEFKDKGEWAKATLSQRASLSQKALKQRKTQGIPIDSLDLPVHSEYVALIRRTSTQIAYPSRWLNSVAVFTNVQTALTLDTLPFVNKVSLLGGNFNALSRKRKKDKRTRIPDSKKGLYGHLSPFVQALQADTFHRLGMVGEGVSIAVLDAGFLGAEQEAIFPNLLPEGHFNFINRKKEDVFDYSEHGTAVLGLLAANQRDRYVGAAPGAEYLLLVTEDEFSEYRLEEFLWVIGLEYADSMGMDMAVSSIGYQAFPEEAFQYTPEQLDGHTALCSRAASIAHSKGMLVVVSAGNKRADWPYLLFPADGRGVLAIGASDWEGNALAFSGHGPTADGRDKPDLYAPGKLVPILGRPGSQMRKGKGTSYAAPQIAGWVACLLGAFPEVPRSDLIELVLQSASANSNNRLPNFKKALIDLKRRLKSPDD